MLVFRRHYSVHTRTYKSTQYYLFTLIIVVNFDLQSNSLYSKLNLFYVYHQFDYQHRTTTLSSPDPDEQVSTGAERSTLVYIYYATVYEINSLGFTGRATSANQRFRKPAGHLPANQRETPRASRARLSQSEASSQPRFHESSLKPFSTNQELHS